MEDDHVESSDLGQNSGPFMDDTSSGFTLEFDPFSLGHPINGSWADIAAECEPKGATCSNQHGQPVSNGKSDEHKKCQDETLTTEQVAQMAQRVTVMADAVTNMINQRQREIEAEPDPQAKQAMREQLYNSAMAIKHYETVTKLVDTCQELMKNHQNVPTKKQAEANNCEMQAAGQDGQQSKGGSVQQEDDEMYLPSTSSGYRPPRKQQPAATRSNVHRPRTRKELGIYIMTLKAKTKESLNPVKLVYGALEKHRVHIADANQKGLDGRVRFYKRNEAEMAEQRVRQHQVNGKKCEEWYEISMSVSSPYSYRTEAFTGQTMHELPFLEQGKIDQKKAAQILYRRNSRWLWAMRDIEVIEVHKIPHAESAKYLLEIHVSPEAHARMQRSGDIQVDLGTTRLKLHDAVRPDECFKCLQPGHQLKKCPEPHPICKYCTGRHLSIACSIKEQPELHRCYKCKAANEEEKDEKRKVDENHIATSTRCRFVRDRRSQQRMRSQPKGNARRQDDK